MTLPAGTAALYGIEKSNELQILMLCHAAPDHGSVENVQGSEERGRGVAFIIVRHGPALAWLQR